MNKRPRKQALLLMALWTSFVLGCSGGGSSEESNATNVPAPVCPGPNQTWTSTLDLDDLESKISNASDCDTIKVEAGSATWARTLTINKGIILQGAGITSGADLTSISIEGKGVSISLALASDVPVRVTGIAFSRSDSTDSMINLFGKNFLGDGEAMTQIRIDHCMFTNGARQIFVHGWAYGVIDHNQFVNGNISVGFSGDDNLAWERRIAAGTADAMFVEDNTFTMNDSRLTFLDEAIYHQEGARSVIRYNTFDGTANTTDVSLPFDTHGNQNYYTGGNNDDFRGQPLIEFYNNTVNVHHTYRMLNIRGGSIIAHHNTFTTLDDTIPGSGSPTVFAATDEESWKTEFFDPLRTLWPAQDQVNNSFFWENTLNGSSVDDIVLTDLKKYPTFIKKGRDYFMHPPEATGGSESYTGRAGGSTAPPTTSDTGSMTFSAAGANAYFPYTPYTHPHPLVSRPWYP
jgi:hypothetical protein